DGSLVHDWGHGKVIDRRDLNCEHLLVMDSWNYAGFLENAFFTEPFQQVLLKANRTEVHVSPPERVTHTFKVKAPLLAQGQTLCLVGSPAAFGNWDPTRALVLNRQAGEDFLQVQLDLSQQSFPVFYKYGVYDVANRSFVRFEEGGDRSLNDAI